MGWMTALDDALSTAQVKRDNDERDLDRRQAEEGQRARRQASRGGSMSELRDRAGKVGINVNDYQRVVNGHDELDWDRIAREVVRREAPMRRREAAEAAEKSNQAEEDAQNAGKPASMSLDAWEKLDTQSKAAMIGSLEEEPDPFGDEEYNRNAGWDLDNFSLDMNEEVNNQAYRRTLLRENKTDRVYTGSTGGSRAPQTTQGITPQKYIARIMEMDPDQLEKFQRDLYAAGFYGSVQGVKDEEPIWGAPDEPTKAAVRGLAYMTMSFKGRLSITETLDRFRIKNDANGDGIPDKEEEEKQKPVITLTSQVDLANAAQDQSVDLMGRRLGEGEVGGATGGYNALESGYQFASQTAQFENTGGTFTAPPTASAYAENQLRRTHGAEVDSYTYLNNVNHLLEMVGLG